MNLSSGSNTSHVMTRPYRAPTGVQTLLTDPMLQGVLILDLDGSIEHVSGDDEIEMEGLARFARASFELVQHLGEASGLGKARWIMTRAREGQVLIKALSEGRILFAIAAHEAPVERLVSNLAS